jgi:hypothetical protein
MFCQNDRLALRLLRRAVATHLLVADHTRGSLRRRGPLLPPLPAKTYPFAAVERPAPIQTRALRTRFTMERFLRNA